MYSPLRVWQSHGSLGGLDNVEYGTNLSSFVLRQEFQEMKEACMVKDAIRSDKVGCWDSRHKI